MLGCSDVDPKLLKSGYSCSNIAVLTNERVFDEKRISFQSSCCSSHDRQRMVLIWHHVTNKPTNKMLQFVLKQDNRKQTKTLIFQCIHDNVHKTWGTAHPSKGVPLFWKITHYISSLSPVSDFWHASASRRITAFTCFNSWSLPAGALYVWECVIASEKQMQRRVCRTGAASHAEMCHEGDTSSQRLVIVKP